MYCRIILISLIVASLAGVVSCKEKKADVGLNNSEIELLDSVHDFGTYHGDTVIQHCSFRLRNAGTEPLIIHDIRASCGCTTAGFSREPIAPGKISVINVSYNGRGKTPGMFMMTLSIYSNIKSGRLPTLTIKGNMERLVNRHNTE